MKLPHSDKAIIDLKKLSDYCLNPYHPVGKHKARVFKSRLGIGREDALDLKKQILQALPKTNVTKSFEDQFGIRYVVNIHVSNEYASATITTIWIILKQKNTPQLVTCYVKN